MKKRPIFQKILFPLMGLVMLEILILVCAIFGQGLIKELNANTEAVMERTVSARKSYLENIMINSWMNLEATVDKMNAVTQELLETEEISLDTLDDNSENCEVLLEAAAPELISLLRNNRVTGAFIVLNTEDLAPSMESGEYYNLPGVYLRDSDPSAKASERNRDILIERSSMGVVRKLGIATDSSWDIRFGFGENKEPYYDFLYYPFQMAYENMGRYSWEDMGYWSKPYELYGEGKAVFSYSVPLLLADGTVYGVLGVDISLEYLRTLIPWEELDETGESAYFLACYSNGKYRNAFGNGTIEWTDAENCQGINLNEEDYHIYMESLEIYNSNAPFSDDNWVLVGAVTYQSLGSYVNKLLLTIILAVAVTMGIGIVGSLVISYQLQKPISKLSKEMQSKDPRTVIELCPTGITEIDQMSEAIERLSKNVLETGRRFTRIIEMASVNLAGFQVDRENNNLFVTEHFFRIFGRNDLDEQNMTLDEFRETMKAFHKYYKKKESKTDEYIYEFSDDSGKRFVKLRILETGKNCYGLAEDVTRSLVEKKFFSMREIMMP